MQETEIRMLDISGPEIVQIDLSLDGKVWVNVDGVCRLRIYGARCIDVDDKRPKRQEIGD